MYGITLTAVNGIPRISIDPPFELFGDFLISPMCTLTKATNLLDAAESVLKGERTRCEIVRDYQQLILTNNDSTARGSVDLLDGNREECEMPLRMFRDICQAWVEHVKQHPFPHPIKIEACYEGFLAALQNHFIPLTDSQCMLNEAKRLLQKVDEVIDGKARKAEIGNELLKALLSHDSSTAQLLWNPTVTRGIEPTEPVELERMMPLHKFRDMCRDWLDYVERIDAEKNQC